MLTCNNLGLKAYVQKSQGSARPLGPAQPVAGSPPCNCHAAHPPFPQLTRSRLDSSGHASCSGQPSAEGWRYSRTPSILCTAYSRGTDHTCPSHYELLGVDPDCDEEDIRAAFRRRAKELHPDLNKDDDATEAFVALKRAYEVLSDPDSRRQYDSMYGVRRLNFFRDVEEEDDDVAPRGGRSPFRWAHVGPRERQRGGVRPFSDEDEDEGDSDDEGDSGGGRFGGGGCEEEGDGDEKDGQGPGRRSEEELLEELARFMDGPGGSLRAWQSGRLDPWGTSTSDTWFRQVERQTRSPYGPSRPGYGSSGDDGDESGREWGPSRRVPGWSPPGRGGEWNHPRRQWDEEERGVRDRGDGPPHRQGGGGGDFRRPFKI